MNIYIPFTYIIGWTKHKKFYYGCKYAQGCKPSDLWESYFTSSEYVEEFRKNHGDPDIIKIHKTFSDSNSCIAFEHKYLTRIDAKNNESFLNKHNGGKNLKSTNQSAKKSAEIQIKKRTHHWLKRPDGTSVGKTLTEERINNKTHHWLKRPDGTSHASDKVLKGTHPLLKTVSVVDNNGNYIRIEQNIYKNQTGNMKNWDFVNPLSQEGLRRLGKPDPRTKSYRVYNIKTNQEFIINEQIRTFCKNNNISYRKILYPEQYPNYEWKREQL